MILVKYKCGEGFAVDILRYDDEWFTLSVGEFQRWDNALNVGDFTFTEQDQRILELTLSP